MSETLRPPRSLWLDAWIRLKANRAALVFDFVRDLLIGKADYIKRAMPIFLTLRDDDGAAGRDPPGRRARRQQLACVPGPSAGGA